MMHRTALVLIFILSFLNILPAQDINQEDGNGRKQGKWVKTYQNGNIRYEGQFRDDMPYGEFHNYFESGNLQAVSKYSDDGIICKVSSFFENGNPMAEGTYVNQKKDGTWVFYSDIDGKKVTQESYSMGELEGRKISFFPDSGEPAEVIYYKDGIKEGLYQKYYTGEQLMVAANYTDGQLDGEYTVYYESGKVEIHGFYKKGMQIGNWEYFDETGKALNEEDYRKQEEPVEKIPE